MLIAAKGIHERINLEPVQKPVAILKCGPRLGKSAPSGDESLINVAPSTRQNFSASSVSRRLHWGPIYRKNLLKEVTINLDYSSPDVNAWAGEKITSTSRTLSSLQLVRLR